MRIYTRTGDGGETGLYGGQRVRKSEPRVEALGALDEANAALGLARVQTATDAVLDAILEGLQHRLFDLGADVAAPGASGRATAAHIETMERDIDRLEAELAPLSAFILPGGSPAAAALHLARAVVRRAERALARLVDAGEPMDPMALKLVNRMSDLLFVAARRSNGEAGDTPWKPGA
jgi:cob(I)alamin adenosyltransferase